MKYHLLSKNTGIIVVIAGLAWFVLSPQARAVCQEGCLTNENTVLGDNALSSNTTGESNTAAGSSAMLFNTTGLENTATGVGVLLRNSTGNDNVAEGFRALSCITPPAAATSPWALMPGSILTTGSNNIDIGNAGSAGEANTIRIGTAGTQTNTFIAGISGVTVANGSRSNRWHNGQLGTVVSSARFKEAIKPMDKASEAILALKPVTFRYKTGARPGWYPAVWPRGRGSGEGESRSGGPRRGRQALHRPLRSGERDVAQ